VVLWDFDGTLAWREGLWAGCVLEVLDEHSRDHGVTLDRLRAALRGRFPWHAPDKPHLELRGADAWWEPIERVIAVALGDVGVEARQARALAPAVRERFIDGSRGWQAFEDTAPALAAASDAGWRNVVLSNHVPELSSLVVALGLDELIEEVFTSALIGYEKPHPEAFRLVLRACGSPDRVWMIGDNIEADVRGAEAVGVPAILVRTPGDGVRRADGLDEAVALILGG